MATAGGAGSTVATPRALPDEVLRPRVIDALLARWDRPLLVVEAPCGYGKSTALAQARGVNQFEPVGLDVFIECGRAERDAAHLAGRLLRSLGADLSSEQAGVIDSADVGSSDIEDLAVRIAAEVSAAAPTDICLLFDDVHILGPGDGGTRLLAALIRRLPPTGHVLLSGRRIPAGLIPEGGEPERGELDIVGTDVLSFEEREVASLVELHGPGESEAIVSTGWPALVRLGLAEGPRAALDFLVEEVVDTQERSVIRAVVATIAAGDASVDLLADVLGDEWAEASAAMATLPLIDTDLGVIRAHAVWGEAFGRLLDPDTRYRLAIDVSEWLTRHRRIDAAVRAAALVEAWDVAEAAVVAAFELGDADPTLATAERWSALFPADRAGSPTACLLRAARARLSGDLSEARQEVDKAMVGFAERDDLHGRAAAGMELGLTAWAQGDFETLVDLARFGTELEAAGLPALAWLDSLVGTAMHDLAGDTERAIRELESVDLDEVPEVARPVILRWLATLYLLRGRADRATASADRSAALGDSETSVLAAAVVHWQAGDPDPYLRVADGLDAAAAGGSSRVDFLMRSYRAIVESCRGRCTDLAGLADAASGRSRDRALLALARAASLVAEGREDEAAAVVASDVDAGALDDPAYVAEFRRFAPIAAVLSAPVCTALGAENLPGTLAERFDLAQIVVETRAGSDVDWRRLPASPLVFTGLPLRWSMELAAAAATSGHPRGPELAEYLHTVASPEAGELLNEMLTDDRVRHGAEALRKLLPRAPRSPVTIVVCGSMTVSGEGIDAADLLRRRRVREVLELLVLRRRTTREAVVDALWPDVPGERARKSLTTTLGYLRRLLEPDRGPGERPFHLRSDDTHLWLERSHHLDVDLWKIVDDLADARLSEVDGRVTEAMGIYERAVQTWVGPVLPDLAGLDAIAPEIMYVETEIGDGAARVAEWAIANRDADRATRVARRLLDRDPFEERAHAVMITAHLDEGDDAILVAAISQYRAAMAELGVDPSPTMEMLLRRADRRLR